MVCNVPLNNAVAAMDPASSNAASKKQEYEDRAMDLLQKAVKAGWKDAAHMERDPNLDTLRGREDFNQLLMKLAAQAPARELHP